MFGGKLIAFLRRFKQERDGTAAVESALVFPLLIFLLLATYDMGNAIITDQKVIRSSQVVGDLITRERTVNSAVVNEAVLAGQLALLPNSTATYGVDIVSIRFNDEAEPEIVWRETRNMTANADVLNSVLPLAEENSGVVVTTIQYSFRPLFGNFIFGDISMEEVAFNRGRKSAVVNRT
jgi:Flp pilus assembly protein TadG